MLTINLEIRQANDMEGVYEVYEVDKDKALLDGVDLGLSIYHQMNPNAKDACYSIVASQEWKDLPDTLYLFREDPREEMGLCQVIDQDIPFPTAISVPVYVIFEMGVVVEDTKIFVMPTMGDTFKA